MRIKYKSFTQNELKVINKGEWVDLYTSTDIQMSTPHTSEKGKLVYTYNLIPLNIAMELPQGYEAIIAPRSSTFKNFGLIMVNSIGVIDSSYCGDNDRWAFPAIGFKKRTINKGERIAQFRLQLSQKATMWQKIKWLFTNKIEFVKVKHLGNNDRGGFGTTGTNDLIIEELEPIEKRYTNESKATEKEVTNE